MDVFIILTLVIIPLYMCVCVCVCVCVYGKGMESMHSCLVARSYLTLYDPWNCSSPCSSIHGILQARILEWVCHSLLQGIFLT